MLHYLLQLELRAVDHAADIGKAEAALQRPPRLLQLSNGSVAVQQLRSRHAGQRLTNDN